MTKPLREQQAEEFIRLRLQGFTLFEAGQKMGWTGNKGALEVRGHKLEKRYCGEIIELMKIKRAQLMKAMDDAKVKAMSGKEMATAVAIFTDKIELLEGRPTNRTLSVTYDLTEDQLERIITLRRGNPVIKEASARVLDSDGQEIQTELASYADSREA